MAHMTQQAQQPLQPPAASAESKALEAKLRAEIAHWHGQAEGEVARQRAFHKALWARTDYTAPQKEQIISMLRAAGLEEDVDAAEQQKVLSAAGASLELPSPS